MNIHKRIKAQKMELCLLILVKQNNKSQKLKMIWSSYHKIFNNFKKNVMKM